MGARGAGSAGATHWWWSWYAAESELVSPRRCGSEPAKQKPECASNVSSRRAASQTSHTSGCALVMRQPAMVGTRFAVSASTGLACSAATLTVPT